MLAVYLILCYRVSLSNLGVASEVRGAPSLMRATWPGRWRMFTELRNEHKALVAERENEGVFQRIDLDLRFQVRRDEGPGFHRDDFYGDPRRLQSLANVLCADAPGRSIRFRLERWKKTLGQVEQPKTNLQIDELGSWPCR